VEIELACGRSTVHQYGISNVRNINFVQNSTKGREEAQVLLLENEQS
jgi:hypothetical protein